MLIDFPTVNLVAVLMVILECGILGVLWAVHRDIRGIGHWAIGAVAISAGVIAIYLRGILPPALSVTAANIAIVTGYVLTWWGLELFFGRRPYYRSGLLLLSGAAAGLVYFSLVEPDTRSRLILLLSLLSLFAVLRAHSTLRRVLPETRFSQLFGGSVMSLQAAGNLLLLTAVIRTGTEPRPIDRMPIAGWIFLILTILSVALVFAAVLLVNQKLQARLRETAQRDQLTGALRRHVLEEAVEREIARSRRHRRPLALLLLDLDHFKAINDRYGHHAGDEALRRFAETAQAGLRREDLLGRTGGEEFCILLPDTDQEGAARLAERIRTAVENLSVDVDGQPLRLTVSIGAAALAGDDESWSGLTRAADVALYRAKKDGRNRIVVAGPPPAAESMAE
ncbi:GGDEF domain-containing protein [Ferrovibrio xuzhouensis]|uniref:diguanylate cyclase n=1 Tax=Ferrovibrio xuzhouensis TaxID=1576914 RepID=A0ABV7VIC1_9PROT